MTDLAPIFNEELTKLSAPALRPYRRSESTDEFMKEAYAIVAHITSLTNFLLSIRQAYLSTVKPPRHLKQQVQGDSGSRKYFTDEERDDIDYQAKSMIRQHMQVIKNLEEAEKLRVRTEQEARKRDISIRRLIRDIRRGMDDEASEEEQKGKLLATHREGVLWLLKNKLERLSEVQREQQETRVMRTIEKNKSILQKSAVAGGSSSRTVAGSSVQQAMAAAISQEAAHDRTKGPVRGGMAPELYEGEDVEKMLSPEQLQIFAKENHDMLQHYEDTLDQVRAAEKSLVEISQLQSQLAANLVIQDATIGQLESDSILTADNMTKANEQLKSAAARGSSARWVFRISVGFCAFLIFMDLIM